MIYCVSSRDYFLRDMYKSEKMCYEFSAHREKYFKISRMTRLEILYYSSVIDIRTSYTHAHTRGD